MDKNEKIALGLAGIVVAGVIGYKYLTSKKQQISTMSLPSTISTVPTETTSTSIITSSTTSTSPRQKTTSTQTTTTSTSTSSTATSETVTVTVCGVDLNTQIAYVDAQGKWTAFFPPEDPSWYLQPYAKHTIQLTVKKDTYLIVYHYSQITGNSVGVFKVDQSGAFSVSSAYCVGGFPIPGGDAFSINCPQQMPRLVPYCGIVPLYSTITITNIHVAPSFKKLPIGSVSIPGSLPWEVFYIGNDLNVHKQIVEPRNTITIKALLMSNIFVRPEPSAYNAAYGFSGAAAVTSPNGYLIGVTEANESVIINYNNELDKVVVRPSSVPVRATNIVSLIFSVPLERSSTTLPPVTHGYTVTIINSCSPATPIFPLPVLVVYTDIDGKQKGVVIKYNEQATIQVYPNTELYVAGGFIYEFKILKKVKVTKNMTLQVCDTLTLPPNKQS